MQTTMVCFECSQSNAPESLPPESFQIPISTKPWVVTKCPQGHPIALIFQASGWARLFERALRRVAANDPRDAVLDAYTAFEMYIAEVPIRARYDREKGADPSDPSGAFSPSRGDSSCSNLSCRRSRRWHLRSESAR